jgi:hypothetical protein
MDIGNWTGLFQVDRVREHELDMVSDNAVRDGLLPLTPPGTRKRTLTKVCAALNAQVLHQYEVPALPQEAKVSRETNRNAN